MKALKALDRKKTELRETYESLLRSLEIVIQGKLKMSVDNYRKALKEILTPMVERYNEFEEVKVEMKWKENCYLKNMEKGDK